MLSWLGEVDGFTPVQMPLREANGLMKTRDLFWTEQRWAETIGPVSRDEYGLWDSIVMIVGGSSGGGCGDGGGDGLAEKVE